MDTTRTNARIVFEPPVARAIEERHGALTFKRPARGETNRTQVVNRDLARYYDLLHDAQRCIRGRFTDEDKLLIVQALQSTFTGAWQLGMLAAEVQEFIEDNDDGETDASAHPLVTKLRALTPTEEMAVVDALERHRLHRTMAVPVF